MSSAEAQPKPAEEPLLPRLLAANTLRSNLEKHMTLNQMADQKAGMIMTASSLIITITLTQSDKLGVVTLIWLLLSGIVSILFSILAILPPWHVADDVNLFYFRSFNRLSEDEFKERFKSLIRDPDRERLYDAYLHEIYFLGTVRVARKYSLIRNGLLVLLSGFVIAALAEIIPLVFQ